MDVQIGIVEPCSIRFEKIINKFLSADSRRKPVKLKPYQLENRFDLHLLLFCDDIDVSEHLRSIAVSLDKFSTLESLNNYVEHKFPFIFFGSSENYLSESKEVSIPRIVHLMWLSGKNDPIPEKYTDNVKRWRRTGYRVEIWNDSKVENLIKQHLPWLVSTYNSVDRIICKCDIARFAVVYVYGGIYFDLDFYLHGDLEALIIDKDLVLTNEPPEHLNGKQYSGLLINGAFAAVPQHEFIIGWLSTMKSNIDTTNGTISRNQVVHTTGPQALYNYFINHGYKFINESNIVSHCLLIPYTMKRKLSKDCLSGEHPIIAYTLWNEGTDWWGSKEDAVWWIKIIVAILIVVFIVIIIGFAAVKYNRHLEHQKLIQSI